MYRYIPRPSLERPACLAQFSTRACGVPLIYVHSQISAGSLICTAQGRAFMHVSARTLGDGPSTVLTLEQLETQLV